MSYKNTDSSAAHRQKLEALFANKGGSSAGTGPQRNGNEKVYASPRRSLGRSPSEYRVRLERLRAARGVEEITEAADAFLAHHQLPDDVDVLHKLLHHPSERVLREAMGQISSLLMQGRLANTLLLEDRLKELETTAEEDSTKSYVNGLRHQLRKLRPR